MIRFSRVLLCGVVLTWGLGTRRASGQISLADDIIIASGGREDGAAKGLSVQGEETNLGRAPGSNAGPYRRTPGSSAVLLGRDLEPVPTSVVRPGSASSLNVPGRGDEETGRGLFQSPERRSIVPSARLKQAETPRFGEIEVPDVEDPGPVGGMTLDQAIERLVHANQDLRTKYFEIPLSQADILTANLRDNPLFFYDTTGVPYGSYSENRPGDIEHGVSIVYPLDIGGKRHARTEVAQRAKRVLEAQFQDAVRRKIDDLYEAFINVLSAREAAHAAQRNLARLERLVLETKSNAALLDGADQDDIDSMRLEHEVAAMLADDEHERLIKAQRALATLLNLPPGQADDLALYGTLNVSSPPLPPTETLIDLALRCRPDLVAHRLGIVRAKADERLAKADRIPDPYFLYTPWSYRDNSQAGLNSISSWSVGLFVSMPIYNRNQGNILRSRINVDQSRSELAMRERQVIDEVRQAVTDYEGARADWDRLHNLLLPAVHRKREKAYHRFERGQIDADAYLAALRDSSSLVRYARKTLVSYRLGMLHLNTAVGQRIVP